MIDAAAKLARLATLRVAIAARRRAAAMAVVAAADRAAAEARAAQDALTTRNAIAREALRRRFVAAPQARAALVTLLDDLRAHDGEDAAATATVTAADAAVVASRASLTEAREAEQTACTAEVRRHDLLGRLRRDAARTAELAAESDAAEAWMPYDDHDMIRLHGNVQ